MYMMDIRVELGAAKTLIGFFTVHGWVYHVKHVYLTTFVVLFSLA